MAGPSDYTSDRVAEVIKDCDGSITAIAKKLNCQPRAMLQYIKSRQELRELMVGFRLARKGLLKAAVEAGRPLAIRFTIEVLGKRRREENEAADSSHD